MPPDSELHRRPEDPLELAANCLRLVSAWYQLRASGPKFGPLERFLAVVSDGLRYGCQTEGELVRLLRGGDVSELGEEEREDSVLDRDGNIALDVRRALVELQKRGTVVREGKRWRVV